MNTSLQFLSGGGEMGSLMRTYNWASSSIGSANTWPQSLRTTISILLNSKFPMFLYWGPDLICFYNDAYRFSLGNDGKHPLLLGMKGEDAWPETWHLVKPPIDQVLMGGEATWSEDQYVPIYRDGALKDAYWTFSFSPVKNESNQTAGVFLTLIETTEKVNNLKKLEESNDQLSFAIEATELGTFDLNPLTNKFVGNNRLKDWFGLPHEMEVDLAQALNVIAEKDRGRVSKAIQNSLEYESGGIYDIEYSITNTITKQERIVRAKGRTWFGDDKIAYRFNGTLQDVTQQVNAKRKTETSAIKFRNLILQAPVLIGTFEGPNYTIGTINKKALEMWDKSYEEVINKPLFEVSPETENDLKKIFEQIYKTGEAFIANEIPIQLKRPGKPGLAYFNSVYQPLRDVDNNIYGIISIGTEITEAVNARRQIEESEKRISNILSQSIMSIGILKGADMVVTLVNEPLLKIWGKGQEIVGKPLLEVMPELSSQAFLKQLNDVFKTGIPYTFNENRAILMNDGKPEERFFSVIIQPYTETDNTISGVTIIGTEVTDYVKAKKQIEDNETEQKKLVSYLKLATDSAKIGVWSLDVASSKLAWSNTHKAMWGYKENYDDLTYEDWYKAILPDDIELAFEKIEESKVNKSIYDVDYRIARANDGAVVWIKSTGQYQYDEFGVAQTLTGISIDITQQKMFAEELENKVQERTAELGFKSTQLEEVNETLAEKNVELENTNAELKSFTYIASHDLQEPLRKIQIFSKLLKESEKFSADTQHYFDRIIAASERMQNLIVSLLQFSRFDTTELDRVPCDLNVIVEESKNDLALNINDRQAMVEFEALPTINGLHIQLLQLFTNLIENAIKYTPLTITPHVKITAEHADGNNIAHPSANKLLSYYAIKIADNGIGFENQYSSKIFELFQRLHGKAEFSGTGIGLAIVKKIATNHNGFIIAQGQPEVGATFTLFLPKV